MGRSFKCFGLLLVLSIMLGSFLNVSSTYSLSHDYNGITLMTPQFPLHFQTENGRDVVDWDYNYTGAFSDFFSPNLDGLFNLQFNGTASDYQPTAYSSSLSFLDVYSNSSMSSCTGYYSIKPIFSDSNHFLANQDFVYYSPNLTNFYSDHYNRNMACKHRLPFGTSPQPEFTGSVGTGFLTCGLSNGASCDGLWDVNNFVQSKIFPYWYTSDGFYVHSTAIDTSSGIHYNHSFSFRDIFNQEVHAFSDLHLPLFSYDDYWFDASNFYSGRHLEWRGVFEFDGSFSWNPNISNNGSYFRVRIYGNPTVTNSTKSWSQVDFPCIANLRTVPDLEVTQLEYSCSGDLPWDSPYLYPVLQIHGGHSDDHDDYVWLTDDDWRFGQQLLVTDYDETSGSSFNTELTGNDIPGDAQGDIHDSSSADWFSSLTNLFNFDFINPFVPIFNLFHNDSCAQIPTLADMLHSQETQVCPWFDSTVRNITTPVLGLSSMMLVFGFVVRWLGSRSGNFIEDSGGIDDGRFHFGNKYRRKK